MSEQSDTPRTTRLLMSLPAEIVARQLERELATATRQLDEALALNAKWAAKAETWTASPEAAQRLQGYRDLAQQVAQAQNERDEARAEVERLRKVLHRLACLGNGDQYGNSFGNDIAIEALAATEAKVALRAAIEQHVAEAVEREREACVVACELMRPSESRGHPVNEAVFAAAIVAVDSCVDAIRARAEKGTK